MHQKVIEEGYIFAEDRFRESGQREHPESIVGIIFFCFFVVPFCEPAAMESDFQESVPVRDPVSGIVLNGEDAAFDTFRSMFKIGKMYAGKIAATVGIDLSVAVRQGAEGIQRVETVGFLLLVGR